MSMPDITAVKGTVLDVRQDQVGQVYAKAFLAAAREADQVGPLVEELESVEKDLLDKFPQFDAALTSGTLSEDETIALIDGVFKGRASSQVINLLKVMAHHHRLGALRMVVHTVRQKYAESRGHAEVRLRSALPLAPELEQELKATLQAKLGIEADFVMEVDPEIIGGLMIQVGDTVYDGSVRTMFERTRKEMVERAIDAIETRPAVFVTSTAV